MSFVGLMAYRGIVLGPIAALIGWLSIFLVFISIYIIYGLIYGLIVGALIGGFCGQFCGIVTLIFFREPEDKRTYIRVMMTISGVVAFLLGVILVGATHTFYAVVEVPLLNEFGLLGRVFAACGAVYAGREIGNRYVQVQKMIEIP